jgi:ABC-2 type transport system permease protein
VRAYRAYARATLQAVIAYRAAFFMSFASSVFTLFALLYLFRNVFHGQSQLYGYTWADMRTYLALAFVLNAEYRMGFRIREGEVALDLTKPIDYQGARFAESLGATVAELASALVVATLVLVLFHGGTPPHPQALALFALSFLLVVPLKFVVIYVTSLLAFWTHQFAGVWWTRQAVTNLFSGAMVPLVFFPGWLGTLAGYLPFRGIVYTPASIFLGKTTGTDALFWIAIQGAWLVGLWLLCRLVWNVAVRQLTVHGG